MLSPCYGSNMLCLLACSAGDHRQELLFMQGISFYMQKISKVNWSSMKEHVPGCLNMKKSGEEQDKIRSSTRRDGLVLPHR